MAYLDQKSGANQRAIIATAVAVLQGAAIIALVHGLAVHFIPTAPKPPLEGRQIDMPLPPPPPMPQPDTKSKPTIQHERQQPLPQPQRPSEQPLDRNGDTGAAGGFPTGQEDGPAVQPSPPPAYPPRTARALNNPGSWLGQDDYPTQELRLGHQGSLRFSLTIGTNGRVETCVVTESSGYPGLDQAACRYISRRARFEPATDGNGSPAIGVYSGRTHWVIPRD